MKNHKKIKAWAWKAPIVLILVLMVGLGLFMLYSQFDTNSLPEYYLPHTAQNNFTYYEWDEDGNKKTLEASYGESGFLTELTGSDFLDAARQTDSTMEGDSSAGEITDEFPDDNLPQDGQAVGSIQIPLLSILSVLDTDKESLITEETAADYTDTGYLHRIGYSCVLSRQMDGALLVLENTSDIPYIIFLDDTVLYSDFPGEPASLDSLPLGGGISVVDQYSSITAREISLSLPTDYVGKTLTVVEYISAEQAASWFPVTADITTPETRELFNLMTYGPNAVSSGLLAAVLIILAMLFIWQLRADRQPWPLLLPIVFVLLRMIHTSSVSNPFADLPIQQIGALIYAFCVYCAGDLLIIFIALKMKRPLRFALLSGAAVHFIISTALLVRQYVASEELILNNQALSVFDFVIIVFGIVLIVLESRNNRFFKYSIWTFFLFAAVYAGITLFYRFTQYTAFIEYIAPVTAATSLYFYPINELLSLFLMLMVTVYSVSEYVSGLVQHRARLATLEQINRLKTEFLGNVSHELKTPLTVMSSYAQLTGKELAGKSEFDPARHNMKLIESEAERLSLMVSQILDVTRIEENRLQITPRICSLTDISQKTLETYYPVFRKNRNKLVFEQPDDDIQVLCDPDRVTQVLVNLISNAAKHTQNSVITVNLSTEEGYAAVEVRDTGKGMDEDQLSHLFDRYYTSEDKEKTGAKNTGTGLGLYICRHIIKEHGGEITVESTVGKGTTVRFTLRLS